MLWPEHVFFSGYYKIESNIYKMESVMQDIWSLKQFLLPENARIQGELLEMKPADLLSRLYVYQCSKTDVLKSDPFPGH